MPKRRQPKQPKVKCSRAERQRRIQEVLRLRLGGAEFADIVQFAAAPEQDWQIGERQIWNYIRAADTSCQTYFNAQAEHLLARHLLQRRQLYVHALAAGDFGTALRVLQDEARLEALYPPTKIAPTTPKGDEPYAIDFTDADRAAALARLYERLGAGPGTPVANGYTDPDGTLLGPPGGNSSGRRDDPGSLAGGIAPLTS
jgi:hypothetical protein